MKIVGTRIVTFNRIWFDTDPTERDREHKWRYEVTNADRRRADKRDWYLRNRVRILAKMKAAHGCS